MEDLEAFYLAVHSAQHYHTQRNSSESSIKLYNEQFLTRHGFDDSYVKEMCPNHKSNH